MSDDANKPPECGRPRPQQTPTTTGSSTSPESSLNPTDPSQLIDSHLDDSLTPTDLLGLEQWLSADSNNLREFILKTHLHHALRQQSRASLALSLPESTTSSRVIRFPRSSALALAASLTLIATLLIWYLTARVGSPVIAQVNGLVTIERGGRSLLAQLGTPLLPGDFLRTSSTSTVTITFAPEDTSFVLSPSTDLRLVSLARGKHFYLALGRLNASVARQRAFSALQFDTPQGSARVLGTKLSLSTEDSSTRLAVQEGKVRLTRSSDGAHVDVRANHYSLVLAEAASRSLSALPQPGAITFEWWNDVTWKAPADALADARFPSKPSGSREVQTFEFEPVATNQFAIRFRGYLHPTETGEYEFWDACSGRENVYLSPSQNPKEKVLITSEGSAIPRDWDKPRTLRSGGTPHSQPIQLEKGRLYYIEAIAVKPDFGLFQLSVAWKRPGHPRELLSAQYISPAKTN